MPSKTITQRLFNQLIKDIFANVDNIDPHKAFEYYFEYKPKFHFSLYRDMVQRFNVSSEDFIKYNSAQRHFLESFLPAYKQTMQKFGQNPNQEQNRTLKSKPKTITNGAKRRCSEYAVAH